MANPTKPTKVNVDDLNTVLTKLQQLQAGIKEGTPGSWDSIGDGKSIADDVKSMQEDVSQQLGQYYGDVTYHVNKSWTDIQAGITTLTSLVQNTISAHSKNDQGNADGAQSVNTTQQPASSSGEN